MKDILHKFFNYAHSHALRLATVTLLVVGGVSQCALTYNLNKSNNMLENEIVRLNNELSQQREDSNIRLASLGSKLDILDSTVKPDEKRRQLIKLVRDAITENSANPPDIRTLNRIAIAIVDNSYTYNLTIAQVLAQMKAESDFNVKAQSRAGAKGLMQIMDATAEMIAAELGRPRYNIWDINTNVEFGCYYMAKRLHEFDGDYVYALRAYNFGADNVKKVIAGEMDMSMVREVNEDNKVVRYLSDRRGNFLQNDSGQRIVVNNTIPEEYRYPLETQNYVKSILKNRIVFRGYGLDKVE